MRRLILPQLLLCTLFFALIPSAKDLAAQTQPLRPVTVGSPMPDITLPVFQGGEVTLSELRHHLSVCRNAFRADRQSLDKHVENNLRSGQFL